MCHFLYRRGFWLQRRGLCVRFQVGNCPVMALFADCGVNGCFAISFDQIDLLLTVLTVVSSDCDKHSHRLGNAGDGGG